jgi:hypothetical protein
MGEDRNTIPFSPLFIETGYLGQPTISRRWFKRDDMDGDQAIVTVRDHTSSGIMGHL